MNRRDLLKAAGMGTAWLLSPLSAGPRRGPRKKPNLVFVFADQWRAEATGYAGNRDVRTPHLDRLAAESVNFENAVSGCPVCCPYRASLLTGQYPLTHGVFLNDVPLGADAVSIAQVYRRAGYRTGYIGKWHLNGARRGGYIPPEERQGFEFWRAYGCTHAYNNSLYYAEDETRHKWEGYDAIGQTTEAQRYIREQAAGAPFVLFLSWGPPHAPYETAPQTYRRRFRPDNVTLRPNVPTKDRDRARRVLAGYYAHIAALDDCLGDLLRTLKETGIEQDTLFVFTSDHGDMLYSHGNQKKQQPWDESIRVPFLLRYPALLGTEGKVIDMPINTADIMPTLLGLSDIAIPKTVEGTDFSAVVAGGMAPPDNAALISCPAPFGQWTRAHGGREYRGVRTGRYTYVRDLNGPWLLYDNRRDPFQLNNLCNKPEYGGLQAKLEALLAEKLEATKDDFRSGWAYINEWGYAVDKGGTAPYRN